jgi:hypothetical protein
MEYKQTFDAIQVREHKKFVIIFPMCVCVC